nr:MAG TPA: hypothetical protein [Caudoviricetes sp.]
MQSTFNKGSFSHCSYMLSLRLSKKCLLKI